MSVLDSVLEESKTTFRSILQKPNEVHLKILNILKESGKVDKTLGENIFVNNHSLPLTIDYSDKMLEFIEYSGGLKASIRTDDFTYSLADIYKKAVNGDYSPYVFLSRYDLDYLAYVIALCAYENDAVNNLLLMFRKRNIPSVEKFEEMFKIIKAAFMQKRKTLLNGLSNSNLFGNKEKIQEMLNGKADARIVPAQRRVRRGICVPAVV